MAATAPDIHPHHVLRIGRDQLRALAPVIVFDVLGPLVVYYLLRLAGVGTVTSLIASGAPPALRVCAGVVRHRQLDLIGVVVLVGIIVGGVAGGISGDAHLVLLDGVVPTVAFGAVCLASLRARRPLIWRFALEVLGFDTPAGQALSDRWADAPIRRAFRVMTVVWGAAYLAEAAAQISVIETASANAAKATSNLLPVAVTVVVAAWNIAYARGHLHRQPTLVAAAVEPAPS